MPIFSHNLPLKSKREAADFEAQTRVFANRPFSERDVRGNPVRFEVCSRLFEKLLLSGFHKLMLRIPNDSSVVS